MKFHDRILFKKAIFVYKSLNSSSPDYICNMFTEINNRYLLRSSDQHMLYIPKSRIEFCRKSHNSGPKKVGSFTCKNPPTH